VVFGLRGKELRPEGLCDPQDREAAEDDDHNGQRRVECKQDQLQKVSKQLSDERKISVRIIEKTSSIKRLLEQIVTPARVMGANTVWLPDGSWESTIRIPRADQRKMPLDQRSAEEAIRILTGEVIHIVFE